MKKGKTCGTREAASLIGVHYLTLHRWLRDGKVKANGVELADNQTLWQWTASHIAAAKAFKATQKPGRPVTKKKAK